MKRITKSGTYNKLLPLTIALLMRLLVKNIRCLVQVEEKPRRAVYGKEMSALPCLNDAWLMAEKGIITGFGKMEDWKGIDDWSGLQVIDAENRHVFPSWCDSHTHLVFAGSREQEFADRIKGLSYQEIAQRGGGINSSAAKLREASEEELLRSALERLNEVIRTGTGAIEIKSGYGLTFEAELKMLRVIKKLKAISPIPVKTTFLGAHAVPKEYAGRKEKYIELIIKEMLPKIAEEKLADYCDVFCEENYFTKDETIAILEAGKKYGLKPKVHAEQLSNSGGTEAGVKCGALSVDHLEYISDKDIDLLKNSNIIPTILPGAQFFLGLPSPPVRKMIGAGLPLAVASDYNPGSCPGGNMNFMVSLACIQNKLSPEEAINAATINSACAMEMSDTVGSIAAGKRANLFITKEIPSYTYLPYAFAENIIETVIVEGKPFMN